MESLVFWKKLIHQSPFPKAKNINFQYNHSQYFKQFLSAYEQSSITASWREPIIQIMQYTNRYHIHFRPHLQPKYANLWDWEISRKQSFICPILAVISPSCLIIIKTIDTVQSLQEQTKLIFQDFELCYDKNVANFSVLFYKWIFNYFYWKIKIKNTVLK
jgi:hypothetical protein